MTDAESMQLLKLLHKFVHEYAYSGDSTVADVADDIARSQDEQSDEAFTLAAEIADNE